GCALRAEVEVVLPDERAVRLLDRTCRECVDERVRSFGVVLGDERVQRRRVRKRMELDPLVLEVAIHRPVRAGDVGAVGGQRMYVEVRRVLLERAVELESAWCDRRLRPRDL